MDANSLSLKTEKTPDIVSGVKLNQDGSDKSKINITLKVDESTKDAMIAVLLTPDTSIHVKAKPNLVASINGKVIEAKTEPQEGKSQWYMFDVERGKHDIVLQVKPGKDEKDWKGKAVVWLIAKQKQNKKEISFTLKSELKIKPLPPHVWGLGEVRKNMKLGEIKVESLNAK
jgi:hypothetical protein